MPLATWMLWIGEAAAIAAVLVIHREVRLARASSAWPTVPATILTAKAIMIRSAKGGSSWFRLAYRYVVAEKEYIGTRFQFAHVWPSFEAMTRAAAALTADPRVIVHVDPRNPQRATLRSGLPPLSNWLVGLGWAALATASVILATTLA